MRQTRARYVSAAVIAGVVAVLAFAGTAGAAGMAGAASYFIWHRVFLAGLPHSNYLVSIEATSARDMWAVGGNVHAVRPYGYAVHWHKGHWRLVHFPDASFSPAIVAASSPADVWIAGGTHPDGRAEAYVWNGHRWHVISMPPSTAGVGQDLVVRGQSDVWADAYSASGAITIAWHWNGQHWTRHRLPVTGAYQGTIAGSPHHGLWAIGTRSRHLAAYLWRRGSWHRMPVPRLRLGGAPIAAASSTGDLWVTGTTGRGTTFLLHRHDSRWTRIDASWIASPEQPAPDGRDGLWLGQYNYWNGRSWIIANYAKRACEGNISTGFDSFAAIPGTRTELFAAGCLGRKIQGTILQVHSRP